MTRALPLAIVELVMRFFGVGARPEYGQALAMFERGTYRSLFDRLASEFEVEDLSDPQYDLGPRWWVTVPGGASFNVRLSYVGPYFLILDEAAQPSTYQPIEALLSAEGFMPLGTELLETPVHIWEPEVGGVLYEFIFEFDLGVPWS